LPQLLIGKEEAAGEVGLRQVVMGGFIEDGEEDEEGQPNGEG
jgi:hypothetical protein